MPNEPRPIELAAVKKAFTADGGHRSAAPAETWDRFAHHLSPITGIVSTLLRVGNTPDDIAPVYASAYHRGGATDLKNLKGALRFRGAGKGMTDIQARVSGLCEAIERYSAIYRGDGEPSFRSRLAELGDAAVHPDALQLFSRTQFDNREAWNSANTDPAYWMPEPFDESIAVDWTPVWSLTHSAVR